MSRPRLAVVGECLIDIRPAGIRDEPRGDAASLALAAARADDRIEVCLATALGDDPLSDSASRTLAAEGVTMTFVQRLPGELPALSVRAGRDPDEPLIWRNGTAIRRLFPVHPGYLRELASSDTVALSATSIAVLPEGGRKTLLQLLRDARGAGRRVALLLSANPTLWSEQESSGAIDRLLSLCSTVFASRRELQTLFGALAGDAAIDALHARGVTEVVVWDPATARSTADRPDHSVRALASTGSHRVTRDGPSPHPAVLTGKFLARRMAGEEIETALSDALRP